MHAHHIHNFPSWICSVDGPVHGNHRVFSCMPQYFLAVKASLKCFSAALLLTLLVMRSFAVSQELVYEIRFVLILKQFLLYTTVFPFFKALTNRCLPVFVPRSASKVWIFLCCIHDVLKVHMHPHTHHCFQM